jgi:hypothetical protein
VTKFGELLKDQTEIPVSTFRPWVDRGDRPMCWQGVKLKTPLTKTAKTPEKGEKPENKTDSREDQSIPSILRPYSTNPREKNEKEKENNSVGRVEYKQGIDGLDCDPLIAVKKIKFVIDYKTDLPGKPYEVVPAGTVAEVALERAEHYIKKGVAEAVKAQP